MLKNILNNRGMSLVETMVALLILMVAFVSIVQTFPFSQSMVKTAENSTKATYLAQNELEQLLALSYGNIPVGTIEVKQRLSADSANYLYYFQRQTTVSYVDGDLESSVSDMGMKKISVTVYYTNSISKTENSYNISALASQR